MAWSEKTDVEKMRAVLAVLPASSCSEQEWVEIGWACRNEGIPFAEYDEWSRIDKERYDERRIKYNWERSGRREEGIKIGSIMEKILKPYGWAEKVMAYYDGEDGGKVEALKWDDELPAIETKRPASEPAKKDPEPKGPPVVDLGLEIKPEPVAEPEAWEPEKDMAAYLRVMFRDGETFSTVFSARQDSKGKWGPSSSGVLDDAAKVAAKLEQKKEIENVLGPYRREAGGWVRINPTRGATDNDIMDFRHALVECDGMDLGMQLGGIHALNLPCVAVVHSGGKSIHAVVRIDAGADLDKYKRRVSWLYDVCEKNGLQVDRANSNAGRLSRLAGVWRGDHKQFLIETHSGAESWAAWREWYKERAAAAALDLEPEPEEENTAEEATPWQVDDAEAAAAVNGTGLGEMTDAFRGVTVPPLPFGLGFAKAVMLAAVCTSAKDEGLADDSDIPDDQQRDDMAVLLGDDYEEQQRDERRPWGPSRAKLRIETAEGQMLNAYVLTIAPPASGKDIGGLLPWAARAMKLNVLHGATPEGWLDSLMAQPNAPLILSEFKKYLNPNPQGAEMLMRERMKELFHAGGFREVLSKRTKAGQQQGNRCADYCAPNILAEVQPQVFRDMATREMQQDGLLSRFLIVHVPKANPYTDPAGADAFKRLKGRLWAVMEEMRRKRGGVAVPPDYASKFKRTLQDDELAADPQLSRLAMAYYPRLAVWLAAGRPGNTVELEADDWRRAATLARWLYGQARQAAGMIDDLSAWGRQNNDLQERIVAYLRRRKEKGMEWVRHRELSMAFSRKPKKDRDAAIENLLDIGRIKQAEADGGGFRYTVA